MVTYEKRESISYDVFTRSIGLVCSVDMYSAFMTQQYSLTHKERREEWIVCVASPHPQTDCLYKCYINILRNNFNISKAYAVEGKYIRGIRYISRLFRVLALSLYPSVCCLFYQLVYQSSYDPVIHPSTNLSKQTFPLL